MQKHTCNAAEVAELLEDAAKAGPGWRVASCKILPHSPELGLIPLAIGRHHREPMRISMTADQIACTIT